MPEICAAGRCNWCGCTFRKPSDVMYHRCAAMQETLQEPDEGPIYCPLCRKTIKVEEPRQHYQDAGLCHAECTRRAG